MAKFEHCKLQSGLDDIEDLTREIELKALNNNDYESAAKSVFDEKLIAKKIAKRNAMITAKLVFQHDNYIKTYWKKDPLGGLLATLVGSNIRVRGARNSLEIMQKTMSENYTNGYLRDVVESGYWDLFASGDIDEDVAEALYRFGSGSSLDGLRKEAISVARSIQKWNEIVRQDKNRFGGYVAKLDGYIARQTHDMDKIRRAAKRIGGDATNDENINFKAWRDYILPLLDKKTFDGVENADEFMKSAWKALASGEHYKYVENGFNKPIPPQGSGSLAKRLSSERLFHFKDGKSWHEYNKMFGKGNLRESVDAGLRMSGHSTALMKMFGPNPNITLQKIMKNAEQVVKDGGASDRDLFKKRKAEIEKYLPILDGSANIPENNKIAKVSASLRHWKSMSSLGGSVLASLPDLANIATEMHSQGHGYLSAYKNAFDGIFQALPASTTKAERHRIASATGIYLRSLSSELNSRFSLDVGVSGGTSRMMKTFYKWNLQNWWTDANRTSVSLAMSRYMADDVSKPLSKLDDSTQKMFSLYNIDSDIWDMIRKVDLDKFDDDIGGDKFFTAEMARNISVEDAASYLKKMGKKPTSTAINNLKDDIELKFKHYFMDRVHYAVVEPGTKTKSWAAAAGNPGTFWGELSRFAMQFKSYPISILYGPVSRRIWSQADVGDSFSTATLKLLKNGNGEYAAMAHMIVMTSALGYLSLAAKDVAKGREPRSLFDENGNPNLQTIKAAFVQGGAAGIYGDYLFNEYNNTAESMVMSAIGPVPGAAAQGLNDIYKVMRSDDADEAKKSAAQGAFRNIINNTPFANLFYTRMAMDMFILNHMKEYIDPGVLRDQERNLKKRTGQEYFDWAKPTNFM